VVFAQVKEDAMTPEEYEAKRQARYERLQAAASRAERESAQALEQGHDMASVIPFGQPILVGHYSEGRDRRYRARIENKFRKGYELHQKAERLRERAEAAKNCHAIFSDDPAAEEKIEARIERLEKRQELMRTANKLVRKKDHEGLLALGFSESHVASLFTPDWCGRVGFADYQLTNNGANIRRLKARLVEVKARADDETSEQAIGAVRIVDSVEDNRLQVFFPGKPSAECRTELKSHGFKWAPSAGAWQRFRGNDALYWARAIVAKFYGGQDDKAK
jgi:hypothetical protein